MHLEYLRSLIAFTMTPQAESPEELEGDRSAHHRTSPRQLGTLCEPRPEIRDYPGCVQGHMRIALIAATGTKGSRVGALFRPTVTA
jgi:hypothetical protein